MNSLFNQLNNQNNLSTKINPNTIQQAKVIMSNTGKINQLIGFLNGKQINAEQLVRAKCQEMGIDVNELLAICKNK